MSADFGAKTAVPPLVDHDLVSCRVVRIVMALGHSIMVLMWNRSAISVK